jgi:ribonuclease HII
MRKFVCGVDEAGRGPLAGPVFAAAVILDPAHAIEGLADSKKLSAKRRDQLACAIKETSIAFAIGIATVEEIDQMNILQATMLAMQRAISALSVTPDEALIDGNRIPELDMSAIAIVGGDSYVPVISAASILAKTARDVEMQRMHYLYPDYGFDRHKGYDTKLHRSSLAKFGPCEIHRKSFGPVKKLLRINGDR